MYAQRVKILVYGERLRQQGQSTVFMRKVIILGSNPMTRLSLIRSVGEAIDCEIIVIAMVFKLPKNRVRKPVDILSKYVDRLLYAQKYKADALSDLLLKKCTDPNEKPFLLSTDDDSAFLIDTILDRLQPYFHCANIRNKQGLLAQLMNKQLQKQKAHEHGFRVTNSWVLENKDGHYVIPDGITYPCYLKGLMSYHTMKCYQCRLDSREQLENTLTHLSEQYSYPMMVEEYLETEKEYGIIGFCDGRECVIPGVAELLDSGHGWHKGVSAFGKIRKEDGEITSKAKELVRSIGLFGLFNMDLAESNGKLYFIELNLRFAAYGYAFTKSGINLPALLIRSTKEDVALGPNLSLSSEQSYINEKVALDDVVDGFRSIKEFKQLKANADIHLMESADDHRPYKAFIRETMLQYIKQRIKNVLR